MSTFKGPANLTLDIRFGETTEQPFSHQVVEVGCSFSATPLQRKPGLCEVNNKVEIIALADTDASFVHGTE